MLCIPNNRTLRTSNIQVLYARRLLIMKRVGHLKQIGNTNVETTATNGLRQGKLSWQGCVFNFTRRRSNAAASKAGAEAFWNDAKSPSVTLSSHTRAYCALVSIFCNASLRIARYTYPEAPCSLSASVHSAFHPRDVIRSPLPLPTLWRLYRATTPH